MKRHPSRQEIIEAALDPVRATAALRDHIAGCPACAAVHAGASHILRPTAAGPIEPPAGALERIIETHRSRAAAAKNVSWSWRDLFLKPVPATSLAAVLAAALIIPLFFSFTGKTGDDMIPAFDMTVSRRERGADRTIPFAPADSATTRAGERARVRLDERVDITLEEGSHLSLEKALRDRSGRKRRLAFILAGGSLTARVTPKGGIEAVFTTPHGRVELLGTVFRIAVNGGSTSVLLREGTLAVTRASGEKTVITGGTKCTISGAIMTAPMDAADIALFGEPQQPRKTSGSTETRKESSGTATESLKGATDSAPGNRTQPDGIVRESASKSAVREEMKNELRGAKEMRRSMRRGVK